MSRTNTPSNICNLQRIVTDRCKNGTEYPTGMGLNIISETDSESHLAFLRPCKFTDWRGGGGEKSGTGANLICRSINVDDDR